MGYERLCAGIFAGTAALLLIYKGETTAAVAIIGSMVGFFVGERNGQNAALKKTKETAEVGG